MIARRCGWIGKGGKPSRDKAQRVGQGLEAKGRIRRVVTVADGQHRRDRIVLLGTRSAHKSPPTAELPHGTADSPHGTANITHGAAELPQGYGENAAGVRQIRGTGTAELPPELDSTTDAGNQTHSAHPPHRKTPLSPREDLRLAEQRGRGGFSDSDVAVFLEMVHGFAVPGSSEGLVRLRVTECSRWLAAKLPGLGNVGTFSNALWRVIRGQTRMARGFPLRPCQQSLTRLTSGFHQESLGLRSSLVGPGFHPAEPVPDLVAGDRLEHRFHEWDSMSWRRPT